MDRARDSPSGNRGFGRCRRRPRRRRAAEAGVRGAEWLARHRPPQGDSGCAYCLTGAPSDQEGGTTAERRSLSAAASDGERRGVARASATEAERLPDDDGPRAEFAYAEHRGRTRRAARSRTSAKGRLDDAVDPAGAGVRRFVSGGMSRRTASPAAVTRGGTSNVNAIAHPLSTPAPRGAACQHGLVPAMHPVERSDVTTASLPIAASLTSIVHAARAHRIRELERSRPDP